MNRMLEIPEPVFAALEAAASASGMTPVGWIAAHLPGTAAPAPVNGGAQPPRTAADLFAGRVGQIASGGRERLSEETGDSFAEYLEAKRRAGRL